VIEGKSEEKDGLR